MLEFDEVVDRFIDGKCSMISSIMFIYDQVNLTFGTPFKTLSHKSIL